MKVLSKVALLGASLAMAMSANAAITHGLSDGQPYLGAKVGLATNALSSTPAFGAYGGMKFNQNMGAEVEVLGVPVTYPTLDGKTTTKVYTSLGAYGTYTHPLNTANPIYLKGRIGAAKGTSGPFFGSGAAGLGYKMDNVNLEALMNFGFSSEGVTSSNSLTLGAHMNF